MPRDNASPAAAVVGLAGGRTGRLIEADDAGQFRVLVRCVVGELAEDGAITRAQYEAAQYLSALFELTGTRQRLGSNLEPRVDCDSAGFFLERLTGQQYKSWRRLSRVFSLVPPHCRSVVEAAVLLDLPPAPGNLPRLRVGLDAVAVVLGLQPRR